MTKKEITIAGHVFSVGIPFTEGHPLTAAEANQLNQVRCENIRNNTATALKKLLNEDGTLSAENLAEATKLVAEYDAAYDFTRAVGAGRRVTDPLEKEAVAIARAQITAALKAKGKAVKDVDKDALAAKIDELAAHPKVVELAKKRLAERGKLSDALASVLGDEADIASTEA